MENVKLNRRGFLSMSTAVAALPVLGAAKAAQGVEPQSAAAPASKDFFVDWTRNRLVLPRIGLKEGVRLRVIGRASPRVSTMPRRNPPAGVYREGINASTVAAARSRSSSVTSSAVR